MLVKVRSPIICGFIVLFICIFTHQSKAQTAPPSLIADYAEAVAKNKRELAFTFAQQIVSSTPEKLGVTESEYQSLAFSIARNYAAESRYDEARKTTQFVIRSIEATSDQRELSLSLVEPLEFQGLLALVSDSYDDAVRKYERALRIVQHAYGKEDSAVRFQMESLVNIYGLNREFLQAELPGRAAMDESLIASLIRESAGYRKKAEKLRSQIALLEEKAELEQDELSPMGVSERPEDKGENYQLIDVFYGTNRKPSGRPDPNRFYGTRRDKLHLGVVRVSVPRNGDLITVKRPSLWRLEFRADPEKHVILKSIEAAANEAEFFKKLRTTIEKSTQKESIVYIHGANTSFRSAIEYTAVIAANLEIDGAPIAYSWASNGSWFDYSADRGEHIDRVIRDLSEFLESIVARSGAKKVHVVAHSLGNEFLLSALERLSQRRRHPRRRFDEIIFASPDVDADDFRDRIRSLKGLGRRMSLYASDKDRALMFARWIRDYCRAGEMRCPVVLPSIVETIDTGAVSRGYLGHADYFNGPAFDDFRAIVWFSLPPQERCILRELKRKAGLMWTIRKRGCSKKAFKTALISVRRLGFEKAIKMVNLQIEQWCRARDKRNLDLWRETRRVVIELFAPTNYSAAEPNCSR